jgi:hypothetical protein
MWDASSTPIFFNASTAVMVAAPGLFVPMAAGKIVIRAIYRYPNGSLGGSHESVFGFAVSPGTTAVKLMAYISGSVVEPDRITGIAGARVEILDGPDAGRSTLSTSTAFYELDYVALGVPFTMRASKEGYAPVTLIHPAITESGIDSPLQFRLSRLP